MTTKTYRIKNIIDVLAITIMCGALVTILGSFIFALGYLEHFFKEAEIDHTPVAQNAINDTATIVTTLKAQLGE